MGRDALDPRVARSGVGTIPPGLNWQARLGKALNLDSDSRAWAHKVKAQRPGLASCGGCRELWLNAGCTSLSLELTWGPAGPHRGPDAGGAAAGLGRRRRGGELAWCPSPGRGTAALLMRDAALRRMAAGNIRDASERARCAARRAIDALILARTGQIPPEFPHTTRALLGLAQCDPRVRTLQDRYFTRRSALHGDCSCAGCCEPIDAICRLIHETADFTRDARKRARA